MTYSTVFRNKLHLVQFSHFVYQNSDHKPKLGQSDIVYRSRAASPAERHCLWAAYLFIMFMIGE